jgi:hypothetical protein
MVTWVETVPRHLRKQSSLFAVGLVPLRLVRHVVSPENKNLTWWSCFGVGGGSSVVDATCHLVVKHYVYRSGSEYSPRAV